MIFALFIYLFIHRNEIRKCTHKITKHLFFFYFIYCDVLMFLQQYFHGFHLKMNCVPSQNGSLCPCSEVQSTISWDIVDQLLLFILNYYKLLFCFISFFYATVVKEVNEYIFLNHRITSTTYIFVLKSATYNIVEYDSFLRVINHSFLHVMIHTLAEWKVGGKHSF